MRIYFCICRCIFTCIYTHTYICVCSYLLCSYLQYGLDIRYIQCCFITEQLNYIRSMVGRQLIQPCDGSIT